MPVRHDIMARLLDDEKRLFSTVQKILRHKATEITGLARGLGDPRRRLEQVSQQLDHLSTRLDQGLSSWLQRRRAHMQELSARLSPQPLVQKTIAHRRLLDSHAERLKNSEQKIFRDRRQKLDTLSALLESLSFQRVLDRGYAVVFDEKGNPVTSVIDAEQEKILNIQFKDGTIKTAKD